MSVPPCRPGGNWEPIDGENLWFANGQTFQHWIDVDEPWPEGTTSWLDIDEVTGHYITGVLSDDRRTFSYRKEPPGGDVATVADRARYRFWVSIPNSATDTDDLWKWIIGECRRKDD